VEDNCLHHAQTPGKFVAARGSPDKRWQGFHQQSTKVAIYYKRTGRRTFNTPSTTRAMMASPAASKITNPT